MVPSTPKGRKVPWRSQLGGAAPMAVDGNTKRQAALPSATRMGAAALPSTRNLSPRHRQRPPIWSCRRIHSPGHVPVARHCKWLDSAEPCPFMRPGDPALRAAAISSVWAMDFHQLAGRDRPVARPRASTLSGRRGAAHRERLLLAESASARARHEAGLRCPSGPAKVSCRRGRRPGAAGHRPTAVTGSLLAAHLFQRPSEKHEQDATDANFQFG